MSGLNTCPVADLSALEDLAADAPSTGQPRSSEASMMMRRLRVYQFDTRIQKPAERVEFCGCCFAQLVLRRGVPQVHGLWR